MRPKVSVIVPVYKAEAYLHRCVDSILAQTFSDFELLLIDDGSPDKSGEICDEYALKDSRVRVFHKENGGVSSARQCGIDNALGEYTIHADPDDWVEPTMLEELYAKAKEEDADMVICDFYEEHANKQIYRKQEPSALDNNTVLKELFQQLHGSCCNKLVKRVCYNKYNISFPLELNCNEDLYICVSLLKNQLTITYLPKAFYHYVLDANDNSLVKKSKSYNELFIIRKTLNELMIDHNFYYLCDKFTVFNLVCNAYNSYTLTSKEFKKNMYEFRTSILTNTNFNFLIRLRLYLSCIGFYRTTYIVTNFIKSIIKK